jgi:hypothetical protein
MAKITGKVGTLTETVEGKKQAVDYNRSASVEYALPETVKDAQKLFGDEVCITMIQRATVTSARNKINSLIVQGATDDEIGKHFEGWIPPLGSVGQRKSAAEKMATKLNKMSTSDRENTLRELQELLEAEGTEDASDVEDSDEEQDDD